MNDENITVDYTRFHGGAVRLESTVQGPTKARFDLLRNSNIGPGLPITTRGTGTTSIAQISADRLQMTTANGYSLVTRTDTSGYGYVCYNGSSNDIATSATKWIKNEDFEHDGAFTSFSRDGNMFYLVNGITGAEVSLDLFSIKNNIVGVADVGKGPTKFSCTDLLEGVYFLIENEDGEGFNLPISAMRIFNDEAMADRFLDAGRTYVEDQKKKLAEMKELRNGFEEGMYVTIEPLTFDTIDGLFRQIMTNSSLSNLKTRLVNNPGLTFRIVHITEINNPLFVYADIDSSEGHFQVPIQALVVSTEEKYNEFEKNKKLIQFRRKIIATNERELESITKSTKELWADLIHIQRQGAAFMKKLRDLSSGEIDPAQELLTQLKSEVEDLKKDKRIADASFDENTLCLEIKTRDIFIRKILDAQQNDKDFTNLILKKPLKIGKFEILIDTNKPEITCVRKSRIRGINGNHPHVASNICWGNMRDVAMKGISDMKIYEVVQILLEILETVRIHDTYGTLANYWDNSPYHTMCICNGVSELQHSDNVRNPNMIPGNRDPEPEEEPEDEQEGAAEPEHTTHTVTVTPNPAYTVEYTTSPVQGFNIL